MARLVVLYKTPKNAEAFDRYYASTHIPIAKKVPGLERSGHPRARAEFTLSPRCILIR
jgi:uncharacterized protein (TIGR02118 family)